ncbi:MAG: exosortase family protein XrtF [Flavobacteriaceae bacterium]|nr:exosortase family protein XrtF [Flavobacteriaceae bacterium]
MRALILKYKLVIRFIVTFLAVYGMLILGYHLYLKFSDGSQFYPDYITNLVARQTNTVINGFGYNASILPHSNEPSIKVIINGEFVARVIEGCNAVSIIILFVAFVVAFSGSWKTTLIYCFAGSIIIYAFNIMRIVILSIGLYHYPEHQELLHKVIFPMFIYGVVFILWMVWVNRFSKKLKTNA